MTWMWPANMLADDLLAARGDDGLGDMLRLTAVAVVLIVSAIGSIWGKMREKQKDQERPGPRRRVPRVSRTPTEPGPATPPPGPPQRRPPVRAIPPRAAPPAGPPPRPGAVSGPPDRPDRQPVAGRRPRRARPAGATPAPTPGEGPRPDHRQAAERPGDRAARLGAGAGQAAREIAEHARRSVAGHAEQTAAHLAKERRLRGAQLADAGRPAAAGVQPGRPPARGLLELPLDRSDLRRAIILAEILGPPVSEREPIQ